MSNQGALLLLLFFYEEGLHSALGVVKDYNASIAASLTVIPLQSKHFVSFLDVGK